MTRVRKWSDFFLCENAQRPLQKAGSPSVAMPRTPLPGENHETHGEIFIDDDDVDSDGLFGNEDRATGSL